MTATRSHAGTEPGVQVNSSVALLLVAWRCALTWLYRWLSLGGIGLCLASWAVLAAS
jgi:hypothetical protein